MSVDNSDKSCYNIKNTRPERCPFMKETIDYHEIKRVFKTHGYMLALEYDTSDPNILIAIPTKSGCYNAEAFVSNIAKILGIKDFDVSKFNDYGYGIKKWYMEGLSFNSIKIIVIPASLTLEESLQSKSPISDVVEVNETSERKSFLDQIPAIISPVKIGDLTTIPDDHGDRKTFCNVTGRNESLDDWHIVEIVNRKHFETERGVLHFVKLLTKGNPNIDNVPVMGGLIGDGDMFLSVHTLTKYIHNIKYGEMIPPADPFKTVSSPCCKESDTESSISVVCNTGCNVQPGGAFDIVFFPFGESSTDSDIEKVVIYKDASIVGLDIDYEETSPVSEKNPDMRFAGYIEKNAMNVIDEIMSLKRNDPVYNDGSTSSTMTSIWIDFLNDYIPNNLSSRPLLGKYVVSDLHAGTSWLMSSEEWEMICTFEKDLDISEKSVPFEDVLRKSLKENSTNVGTSTNTPKSFIQNLNINNAPEEYDLMSCLDVIIMIMNSKKDSDPGFRDGSSPYVMTTQWTVFLKEYLSKNLTSDGCVADPVHSSSVSQLIARYVVRDRCNSKQWKMSIEEWAKILQFTEPTPAVIPSNDVEENLTDVVSEYQMLTSKDVYQKVFHRYYQHEKIAPYQCSFPEYVSSYTKTNLSRYDLLDETHMHKMIGICVVKDSGDGKSWKMTIAEWDKLQ